MVAETFDYDVGEAWYDLQRAMRYAQRARDQEYPSMAQERIAGDALDCARRAVAWLEQALGETNAHTRPE